MEGRLTEKIDLARSEGDQRDGFLEELLNRVDKAIKASNDAAAKVGNTRQVLSDKVGELMTRYQYLHACVNENSSHLDNINKVQEKMCADIDHICEYLRKAENRILELEQWDVDAHEKLCEIGSKMKAQQNWNEKIGTFMADIGAQVYKLNKETGKAKCTKSKNS